MQSWTFIIFVLSRKAYLNTFNAETDIIFTSQKQSSGMTQALLRNNYQTTLLRDRSI